MPSSMLDLLDAITDIRVQNPELRAAVLSTLRLTASDDQIRGGRLYVLRQDGEIRSIITHGESSISEERDKAIIRLARERRETIREGQVTAVPLGKSRRIYGVLFLERATEDASSFLGDLILQWAAVAEFTQVQRAELLDENFQLREEIKLQWSSSNIIGVSGGFRRVVDQAMRVAGSTATVLLTGETGTGKELVARLIHNHSPRANGPFITVNCGALPESLLESELFGHAKNAFSGAVADRKGRFEGANGGTIFLDEIGEISPAMQVRLLRVLQEAEIVRVGEQHARKLDVRVIAATNRDLEEEVAKGRFRSDLFYRLNVVYLTLPPLRQRPEDIPPLAEHFLGVYCQRNCKYIEAISRDVLEIMQHYPWPGNVRELENCIEKMVVMAPGKEISPDLLPMALMAYRPGREEGEGGLSTGASFEQMLKKFMLEETQSSMERGGGDLYDLIRAKWERYLFEIVLDQCKNNKSRAASLLGITRNTLSTRLGDLCQVKREWTVE